VRSYCCYPETNLAPGFAGGFFCCAVTGAAAILPWWRATPQSNLPHFSLEAACMLPHNGGARMTLGFNWRSGVRKQLNDSVSRRRGSRASRRSSSQSLACSTQVRLLRFETLEDRRMLSADLVSKAAFPSLSASGTSGVVSANGRYVAFVSGAETLTSLDNYPGYQNVYRFDRVTGEVELVSVDSAGTGRGAGTSENPAISADGNVVVFSSTAANLHPLDTNSTPDIFARNLTTGVTYLVSVRNSNKTLPVGSSR
jgi:hypothetical protein